MSVFSKNLKIAREMAGLKQGKLGELVNLKANTISNYENGVSSPDYDTLISIVKILDVSLDWLIIGDIKKSNFKSDPIIKYKTTLELGIPLIPPSSITNYFSGILDNLECDQYFIPLFKGADFLLGVRDSSMQPTYNSGDIVACQKVPSNTFFQWNKIYVLDTEQGALVKRVKMGISDDTLILSSDNSKYADFEIQRSKIQNIALVIGVMRLE